MSEPIENRRTEIVTTVPFEHVLLKANIEAWRSLKKQATNKRLAKEYEAFKLGMGFDGLSKSQQRDFDYYLNKAKDEKCYPNHFSPKPNLTYKPKTTEEWYWLWDTHGYSGPLEPAEPNVSECEGIKQSKEFLNLTVKMWVESCIELPASFEFEEARNCYPMSWVWKSFKNQLIKKLIERDGFVISFVQNRIADQSLSEHQQP
jgi:hypothetical protein